MILLKQSTASQELAIGPLTLASDAGTAATGLTLAASDIKLWKNAAAVLVSKNSGGATELSGGVYLTTLDATDTAVLGPLSVFCYPATTRSSRVDCHVVTSDVFDFLTSGVLPTDSVAADSIQTAAYSAIGASVASDELEALKTDHAVPGTIGRAVGDIDTAVAALTTAVASMAAAVAARPTLADITGALDYVAGQSPGGGATNALVLDPWASAVDTTYAGDLVIVVAGAGVGQAQVCESYVGATRTMVFPEDWPVPVDATSFYAVLKV